MPREKRLHCYKKNKTMPGHARPFIIPVFLPNFGCPHQCAFCNQPAITGIKHNTFPPEKLRFLIHEFLQFKDKNRSPVQIAFYGGNFLGLKEHYLKALLDASGQFVESGEVDGIRFSTRPDTITNERLDILKEYPVTTIELGVQSMDDQVLAMAKRGHTAGDTIKAVGLLKERGYTIGLQMMVGLPGDDEATSLATGRSIADLAPDCVRIYPTVVLKNSLLARWYKHGQYTPLSLEPCVTLVKKLYLLFDEKKIPVIRMGLQASKDFENEATILAGPYHPAFGHLVYSEIFLDMVKDHLRSNREFTQTAFDTLLIKVHPQSISKMRGLKNKNIEILKNTFPITSIAIIPDQSVAINASSVSFS